MKKKTSKRGFTIVELVIVIAVIAILAAVLIPTFANLIKKANLSADQQAVRQINTQIATIIEENEIETLADLIVALREHNVDIEDYKALTTDHYFYFVKSAKQVILADKDNNVVFPENSDITYTAGDWSSLSGAVVTDDTWTVEGTKATVTSGAQLVDFMKAHTAGEDATVGVTEIVLSGTIDMMGADVVLNNTGNLTITGGEAGATLMNARSEQAAKVNVYGEKDFNYGLGALFGVIQTGTTVTVENITIDGASVGDIESSDRYNKYAGVIAGEIQSGAKLIVNNVTVKNSTVIGVDKVGALVGVSKGTVELSNVTVENTKVIGHNYVAKLIGVVNGSSATVSTSNVTVADTVTATGLAELGILHKDASSEVYVQTAATYRDGDPVYQEGDTYYYNLTQWDPDGAAGSEPAQNYYLAGVTDNYWWVSNTTNVKSYDRHNGYLVYLQPTTSADVTAGVIQ